MSEIELVWPDDESFRIPIPAVNLEGVLAENEHWLVVVEACFDSALGWQLTVASAEGMAVGNLRYKPEGMSQFLDFAEKLGHPIRQTSFPHWNDARRMLNTFNQWAIERQAEQMTIDLMAGEIGWSAALRIAPKAAQMVAKLRPDLVNKRKRGDKSHPTPSDALAELYAEVRRKQREGYSELSACAAACIAHSDLVKLAFPDAEKPVDALRQAAMRLDHTKWSQRKDMPKTCK